MKKIGLTISVAVQVGLPASAALSTTFDAIMEIGNPYGGMPRCGEIVSK